MLEPEGSMRTAHAGTFGGAVIVAVALLAPTSSPADPVAVAHWEGMAHGFISLRTLDGAPLADGDLIETTVPTSDGNRVTTRLVLRFKDGSKHEETTVYVQSKTFRFVSNHVVQNGPAFKMPIESTIAASGQVNVRYTDEGGKENRIEERVALPPDVANGMILALLKNISPRTAKTTVSMVAITPKPRLVKLVLIPAGEEPFSTAASGRHATHYLVKVDVPGITGAIASLLGKTPPDSHVWVLSGEAPTFVKAELALFLGGPMWRLELVSPVWPSASASPATKEPSGARGPEDAKH
jgi:hypothetical protein